MQFGTQIDFGKKYSLASLPTETSQDIHITTLAVSLPLSYGPLKKQGVGTEIELCFQNTHFSWRKYVEVISERLSAGDMQV